MTLMKKFVGWTLLLLLAGGAPGCISRSSGGNDGAKQGLGECQAGYDHLSEACNAEEAADWADWCEEKGFPDFSDAPCAAERQALTDCNRNGVVSCGDVEVPGFRIECTDPFNELLYCEGS